MRPRGVKCPRSETPSTCPYRGQQLRHDVRRRLQCRSSERPKSYNVHQTSSEVVVIIMKITTIDDFVEQKVAPEHRAIVGTLRELMKKYAPDAKEVLTYGILGWRQKRILAVISPTKKDITFAFSRGADFTDRHGLLRGVGKVSKHVKIKRVSDINEPALRDYIEQALELDKR